MAAPMLMPERAAAQGKHSERRPALGELLSRLTESGTGWLHAELGLVLLDAGVLLRRILMGIALAIIAFALLTTALVSLSGALIPPLAHILDSEMLAGVIVAAGFFACAVLASFASALFLAKRWPAESSVFRTILDRGQSKAGGDD